MSMIYTKNGKQVYDFNGQTIDVQTGLPINDIGGGDSSSDYNTSSQNTSGAGPYGVSSRNTDWETTARQEEQSIATTAGQEGIVDPNFIAKLTADPSKIGFYVNALAYGGYTPMDILNDIKRLSLVDQGNTAAGALKLIDPELNKTSYMATSEGAKAYQDFQTQGSPSYIDTTKLSGALDPSILKYTVQNIPDAAFNQLVPIQDVNSQAFKDAVDEVKSKYFDLTNDQLQAQTEQQKSVADYNLKSFTDNVNRMYGVQLSNNASTAFKQIDSLGQSYAQRGLNNSGLQNNEVDDYLKGVRKQDDATRATITAYDDSQEAAQMRASASPEQIQALIDEDKAKGLPQDQWRATLWGLIPSADIAQKYSMDTLRSEFPGLTDAELQTKRDAVLDQNGNYRSTIYQNYYSQVAANNDATQSKAETSVLNTNTNQQEEAARLWDNDPANQFSGNTPKDTSNMNTLATNVPGKINAAATPVTSNPPTITPPSSQNLNPDTTATAAAASKAIADANAKARQVDQQLGTHNAVPVPQVPSTPAPVSSPVPSPSTTGSIGLGASNTGTNTSTAASDKAIADAKAKVAELNKQYGWNN